MLNNSNSKGVWFYGLSGSGKTHASKIFKNKIKLPFIIDGDEVRANVSSDLGFTTEDRQIQLSRVFGISKLCINNGYFPIISTVTMSEEMLQYCTKHLIIVAEIQRPRKQLLRCRQLYNDSLNVVGIDITQPELNTLKIKNDGTSNFEKLINRYVK